MAAYQCLSNAYIGSQRWDKGIEVLEAAYQLLTPTENPVVRISVLSQLVSVVKKRRIIKNYSNICRNWKTLFITTSVQTHP